MAYKFPTQGGCWFCYMDDEDMHFSTEFDTWFHMDCLNKELEDGNPEAEIIATEYNIPFTTKFPEPEDYYPDDGKAHDQLRPHHAGHDRGTDGGTVCQG